MQQLPKTASKHRQTPQKQLKSNAKGMHLRVINQKLQELYKKSDTIPDGDIHYHDKIYLECIELTQKINNELEIINYNTGKCWTSTKKNHKKPSISLDMRDILSNNITLGMKLKYKKMIAAFIYITTRVLKQGMNTVGYYLNVIKSIKNNSSKLACSDNERDLACQIKFFLTLGDIVEQKSSILLKKCLISLCRILENDSCQLSEQFYHWGLQQSSANNKFELYIQFFTSYLQHLLNNHQKVPHLDICRLISDMFSFNQPFKQHINIMRVLIRNSFYLIAQKFRTPDFYIEDNMIQQASLICLQKIENNCGKTVLSIFQCLFKINKIHLIIKPLEWKDIQFQQQMMEKRKHRKSITCSHRNMTKICRFISSAYLLIHQTKDTLQTKEGMINLNLIKDLKIALQQNINILMSTEQGIIFLWCQLINEIHPLKSEMFTRSARKNILKSIDIIKQWTVFVDIQDIILSHPIHIQASNNQYSKYTSSNLYLLLINNLISSGESHRNHCEINKNMIKLTQRMNQFGCSFNKYWDQLLSLCLFFINHYFNSNQSLAFINLSRLILTIKFLFGSERIIFGFQTKQENDQNLKEREQLNSIIQICLFLVSTQVSKSQTPLGFLKQIHLKQLFCTKLLIFRNFFKHFLAKLISYNSQNQQKKYIKWQREMYGFFLFMYSIYKPFCCHQELTSLKKAKSQIINRLSTFEDRIEYRKIFQRLLAQQMECFYHSRCNQMKTEHPPDETLIVSDSYTINRKKSLKIKGSSSFMQLCAEFNELKDHTNHQNFYEQLTEMRFRSYLEQYASIHPKKRIKNKEQNQLEEQYQYVLAIDYFSWVKHFCSTRMLGQLEEIVSQCLEDYISNLGQCTETHHNFRKSIVSSYLKNLQMHKISVLNCRQILLQYLVELSEKSKYLQIVIQCYNKIFYLLEHLNIENKNSQQKIKMKEELEGESLNESNKNQSSDINIQFEIEESSVHISKLLKLFTHLSKKLNKIQQFSSENKNFSIINCNRMIVALNNIIGIAANINYRQKFNLISSLEKIKFKLAKNMSNQRYYYEYAQSIFLNHGQYQQQGNRDQTASGLENDLSNINDYLSTNLKIDYTNVTQKMRKSMLINAALFINFKKSSIKIQKLCRLQQMIYMLQNLQHIHPHKKIVKNISSYIWSRAFTNQSRIIQYKSSILPITHSALLQEQNQQSFFISNKLSTNTYGSIDWSIGQLTHCLLTKTLSRILKCLLNNNQISQFRSVLKLSLIFFIRSRNILCALQALQCYIIKNTKQTDNINILLISDSIRLILSNLYGEQFQIKKYDNWCNKYLSDGRNRKSAVFQSSPIKIAESLGNCLKNCNQIGYRTYNLLITCIYKSIKIPEWVKFHYGIQLNPETKTSKQLHIQRLIDSLMPYLSQKSSISASFFKQQQYLILQQLRQTAPESYRLCQILQSILSSLMANLSLDYHLDLSDHTILEISVLMLDHNYHYKQMIEQTSALYQQSSPDNVKSMSKFSIVSVSNSIYSRYVNQYLSDHFKKIAYLQSDRLKYPLTIIYPLGHKIYIISCVQPVLVIAVDRTNFEDYILTVNLLLQKNQAILNDIKIDPKEWWKNRDRFNREIGKIVNEIDLITWDASILLEKTEQNIRKKFHKLLMILKSNYSLCEREFENTLTRFQEHYFKQFRQQFPEYNLSYAKTLIKEMIIQEKTVQNQNLLLLIPSQYYAFPFQTNQYLSSDRAVYRLPSIAYLYQNQPHQICKLLKIQETKYLINSRNDLPETQTSFLRIKQDFCGWKGIIGKKPTFNDFQELFKTDLFLYMGHGAGTGHISEKQFYTKVLKCSIMLFGCSSVAIAQNNCQYHGIALSHLINGCPCLLGCLWEVTDRDTDKLTQKLFKSILQGPQNIAKILNQCRKRCRHEFLNGGAIVIYGLPTYFHCS